MYATELREQEAKQRAERYVRNIQAIQNARPGGDLYGVLEKTASRFQELRKNSDNDKNWFDAQTALAAYTSSSTCHVGCDASRCLDLSIAEGENHILGITGFLRGSANNEARTLRGFFHYGVLSRMPSPFDIWMIAQTALAENAAGDFCRRERAFRMPHCHCDGLDD